MSWHIYKLMLSGFFNVFQALLLKITDHYSARRGGTVPSLNYATVTDTQSGTKKNSGPGYKKICLATSLAIKKNVISFERFKS